MRSLSDCRSSGAGPQERGSFATCSNGSRRRSTAIAYEVRVVQRTPPACRGGSRSRGSGGQRDHERDHAEALAYRVEFTDDAKTDLRHIRLRGTGRDHFCRLGVPEHAKNTWRIVYQWPPQPGDPDDVIWVWVVREHTAQPETDVYLWLDVLVQRSGAAIEPWSAREPRRRCCAKSQGTHPRRSLPSEAGRLARIAYGSARVRAAHLDRDRAGARRVPRAPFALVRASAAARRRPSLEPVARVDLPRPAESSSPNSSSSSCARPAPRSSARRLRRISA